MEKISKIKIGCKPYEVYDPSAHEKIEQITDRDVLKDIVVEAHVDDTTGTPNVAVVKGENKITLNFSGLKGETGNSGQDAVQGERGLLGPQGEQGPQGPQGPQGEPGYDGKTGKTPVIGATATYDYSVAGNQPHVHVDVDGEPEHPVFNFRFSGLRGQDGADGQDGRNGRDGVDGQDGKDGIDGMNAKAEDIERAVHTEIESQLDALDADLLTLSWLKYAIDGYEDDKQAFARLIAAARDYKDSGKTKLDEAYAGVNALVTKQPDGSYKATSILTSLVGSNTQGGSQEGYSGVITSADIHEAMVDVFANYTDDANTMTARIFALANANGSNILLDADQINLNGHVWADLIDANLVVTSGLDGLSESKVSVNSNGIIVTNGTTATTGIMPGQILLGSSGAGTNYIGNGSLALGYLSYSASDNTLRCGNISSNGILQIDEIRSVNSDDDSTSIKIHTASNGVAGTVNVNASATISLSAPTVACAGNFVMSDGNVSVTLTAEKLRRLLALIGE